MSFACRLLTRTLFRRVHRRTFLTQFHTGEVPRQAVTEENLSIENETVRKYLQSLRQEFYNLKTLGAGLQPSNLQRIRQLSEVVSAFEQRDCVVQNMNSLEAIENEKDPEMKELIKEEREVYRDLLMNLNQNIMRQLLTLDSSENYSSLFFEITAGVGGQEAMLFANDLFGMYTNFFDHKGWNYEVIHADDSEIGGLRHATILVEDDSAYKFLKHEGGVHRVQRVPATEKSGRIHTSTISVAVIPRPDDIEMIINEKDLKMETKRASGAGGQHVNTTDSAVRITHIPTGTVVECQTDRSQVKNREIALKKLQTKLIERSMQAQEDSKNATRKAQVGTSNRNEKIRTYNFIQDRITDHRLKGGTLHNLKGFLEGGEPLDGLINQLMLADRKTSLLQMINSMSENTS